MTLTLASLRIRFPQVSDVAVYSDEYMQALLDEAGLQIVSGTCQWGGLADTAQGYLAMHLLAMASPSTGVGLGIQSVSAGQASVSYWGPSATDGSSFGMTPYGREYMRLLRLQGPVMRLVDDDCLC